MAFALSFALALALAVVTFAIALNSILCTGFPAN